MPELTITNASIALVGLVVAGGCLYLLYRLLVAAGRRVCAAGRALATRLRNRRAESPPAAAQSQPALNVLWDAPLAIGTTMPINGDRRRSEKPDEFGGETDQGAAAPAPRGPQTLTRGMKWALAIVGIIAAGLVLYGFTGSYSTLLHLAKLHGVPLPQLNPIGVDAGLVGVVLLDIVLTWIGYPIAWLRQIARGLAIATVALNASAGWPDATAVTLHVFAPVLIIVIVEAARVTLLRRARIADNTYRDPIPIMRWILDPFRTPGFYRRMVLWGQTSYPAAIDLEIQRRQAIMALRAVYGGGRTWRKRAPADLVWMITSGVRITDALTRVRIIVERGVEEQAPVESTSATVSGRPVESTLAVESSRPDIDKGSVDRRPTRAVERPRPVESTATGIDRPASTESDAHPETGSAESASDLDDLMEQAREINNECLLNTGKPVSAEMLRRRLHIGSSKARPLRDAIWAEQGHQIRAVNE